MDTRNGLAREIAEQLTEDGEEIGAQLPLGDLLGLRVVVPAGANEAGRPRGVGRPPGARNRRTVAWREHILSRFRSPLVTLASIQAMPVEELAASLGCSRLEALQEIRHAAVALIPYLHERLTPEQNTTNNMVHLTIGGAAGLASAAASEAVEVLDYQGVGDEPAGDV